MATGQRIGYKRCSSSDQNTDRQLDGLTLDRVFTDLASGKDTNRPAFAEMMRFARVGDHVICHSMDRLSRSLDDLRRTVKELTGRGVTVEFVKEHLVFTGEDSPMANLLLSVMGAFAEFERSLLKERQREGIVLAKARGAYKGRKRLLSDSDVAEIRRRLGTGEKKAVVARAFHISRETLYAYLRRAA
jgi:DNA invertase Pin-like site-specific DNA recombinase